MKNELVSALKCRGLGISREGVDTGARLLLNNVMICVPLASFRRITRVVAPNHFERMFDMTAVGEKMKRVKLHCFELKYATSAAINCYDTFS